MFDFLNFKFDHFQFCLLMTKNPKLCINEKSVKNPPFYKTRNQIYWLWDHETVINYIKF